jgi:hypothetical protein
MTIDNLTPYIDFVNTSLSCYNLYEQSDKNHLLKEPSLLPSCIPLSCVDLAVHYCSLFILIAKTISIDPQQKVFHFSAPGSPVRFYHLVSKSEDEISKERIMTGSILSTFATPLAIAAVFPVAWIISKIATSILETGEQKKYLKIIAIQVLLKYL